MAMGELSYSFDNPSFIQTQHTYICFLSLLLIFISFFFFNLLQL